VAIKKVVWRAVLGFDYITKSNYAAFLTQHYWTAAVELSDSRWHGNEYGHVIKIPDFVFN
jgi:hypothetical protein